MQASAAGASSHSFRPWPLAARTRWRMAAAVALAGWVGVAAADPYAGAQVSATVRDYSLICGTCPTDSHVLFQGETGGPGSASARLGDAGTGWAFSGTAALAGPMALPELGGYAFTDIVVDPSIPKTFFYKSGVTSQATQRYDYSGGGPQTYRIEYTVEGSFVLGALDAASLMQVLGGLTVYGSNYNPQGEVHGTVLDTSFVGRNASMAGVETFSLNASVSFTVAAGDSFYIWSLLDVYADSSHQVIGSVDAAHTLRMQFTQGDTSLLAPAISAVPEPGLAALWAVGVAVLVGWLRSGRRALQCAAVRLA